MANEHLHVQFYMDTVQNERETVAQGRPIFKEIEMVKIKIAGDKGTEIVAPAHEKAYTIREGIAGITQRLSYAEFFPDEFAAFKRNEAFAVSGTPIEEATFLTLANRAELKALNIYSIEALAGLEKLDKLGMNGERFRDQARAYLNRAQGAATDGKLLSDNEELKRRLAIMEENYRQLLAKGGEGTAQAELSEALVEAVEKPGPFFGYTPKMLREFIKEKTNETVKGNPKLGTLLSMAEEALESA
jgi:hypothetical protein